MSGGGDRAGLVIKPSATRLSKMMAMQRTQYGVSTCISFVIVDTPLCKIFSIQSTLTDQESIIVSQLLNEVCRMTHMLSLVRTIHRETRCMIQRNIEKR